MKLNFTCLLLLLLLLSNLCEAGELAATIQSRPKCFIENKGQVTDQYGKPRKDIDAKLETPGLSIFIGPGQIHYQWYRHNGYRIETYRMDVMLKGANPDAIGTKEEFQPYVENYYGLTATGVTAYSFNRLVYRNIYPGIDWVLYCTGKQLKYDFLVHPGVDASAIRLQYSGASSIILEDNGEIVVKTPFGQVHEAAPYSYSVDTRAQVYSRYKLEGRQLSFVLAAVPTGSMIIDPALSWATYYGGSAMEEMHAVSTDVSGNAYAAGQTLSSSNIATSGAHQQTIGGSRDGFIVKFNSGGARQWASYYGGSGNDEFFTVVCESNGGVVYAGGKTESNSGIASIGAHQAGIGGLSDGLLVKLNGATGQRIWASYYGGSNRDSIQSICLDPNNNIYVAGTTLSSNNIATSGSHTDTYPSATGQSTGFLVKFLPGGSRLWATYYGDSTYLTGVTSDGSGNVIVVGASDAKNGIATPGAHQSIPTSSLDDAIIIKFNANGVRQWGTYYGGGAQDMLFSVAADASGNIYAGGLTSSTSGIATAGSFQTTLVPGSAPSDGFIVKLNNAGVRQWGTYYGSVGTSERIHSLTVGPDQNLYVAGGNINAPGATALATAGSYQPIQNGSGDVFMGIFNLAGQRLYGTYYGGPGNEFAFGIACSANGKIYITGWTGSSINVATSGGHQVSYGGGFDGFLAQFDADTAVFINLPATLPKQWCKGDSVTIQIGVTQSFAANNVFTVQLSDAAGSFASPATLGSITSQGPASLKVQVPSSPANGSGYRIRIAASNPAKTSYDNGIDISIYNYPAKPVAGSNGPLCLPAALNLTSTSSALTWSWTGPNSFTASVQNPSIANPTLAAAGDYVVTAENPGCIAKDTVTVVMNNSPTKPIAGSNAPLCAGASLDLSSTTSTSGVSYSWQGPNNFTSSLQNPSIAAATPAATGDYIITVTINGCSASDTSSVVVSNVSSIGAYASPNDTVCAGTQLSFVAVPSNSGPGPQYQWFKNGTPITGATSLTYSTNSYVSGDSFYCRMIAPGVCSTPLTLYTPGIKIIVLSVTVAPSVTITSNPSPARPGVLNNFIATATNGGGTPTYQWRRNGTDQPGATSANWSASGLHPYDKISCVVTSSDPCASPKNATSNEIVVNFPTGIDDVEKGEMMLYPNPNDGRFTIDIPLAPFKGGIDAIEVVNVVGQVVFKSQIPDAIPIAIGTKFQVTLPETVVSGVYLLRVKSGDEVKTMKFTVQR